MSGPRAVAAALVAALSTVLPVGAPSADEPEASGVNDLRLQVERLERAEQADVVGSDESAMLFDPGHRAAALAAAEARRRSQRADSARLFLGGRAPYRVPVPTSHLFDTEAYPRATTARDSGGPDDDPGWSVGPLAVVALLAAGAALSVVVRHREERADA